MEKLPALALILIIYITLCLRVYTRFIIHNDSYNLNESENGKVSEELKKVTFWYKMKRYNRQH